MGERLHNLALALCLSLVTGATASACTDPLDPHCGPVQDPCAGYVAPDLQVCRAAQVGQCRTFKGPPLQSCVNLAVLRAQQATGTGTSTSTGTSTATGTNRATNWDATHYNDGMFDPEAGMGTQGVDIHRDPLTGSVTTVVQRSVATITVVSYDPATGIYSTSVRTTSDIVTQNESYAAASNVFNACVDTNVSGRDDGYCATHAMNPECTGMFKALNAATTCVQYGPVNPVTGVKPCLKYGAAGYTMDEWLVFGQQYYNSMTGCFTVGDLLDATGQNPTGNRFTDRGNRMTSQGDMAAMPLTDIATGIDKYSPSTITGSTRRLRIESGSSRPSKAPDAGGVGNTGVPAAAVTAAETSYADTVLKTLSERVNDGAEFLGFDRGELLRRSAKGESFEKAVTDSPFHEKLEKKDRETVELALGSPAEVMEKIKERRTAAGEDTESLGKLADRVPSGGEGSRVTGAPGATPGRRGAEAGGRPGTAGSAQSSRDLDAARALLGGPSAPARGAANASAELRPDASLFERVTLSYRRYTPKLRALDSKTARDVRLTEKPSFFNDL